MRIACKLGFIAVANIGASWTGSRFTLGVQTDKVPVIKITTRAIKQAINNTSNDRNNRSNRNNKTCFMWASPRLLGLGVLKV